jgi:serine/threonine protein phosphatase PrpC
MKISAFGKSDRGKRRPNNEDDLALVDLTQGQALPDQSAEHLQVGETGVLLAVCDGVGGRRAGEVASGLALEVLSEEMESLAPTCPKRDVFRAAVEKVNARVWQQARQDSTLEGMATTLTAAVVCRERAILAHVGDSRAYFLRGERIRQITRDQSFVESLIEAGAIREEEAAQSPYRNVILQAIGRKKSVEVALDAIDVSPGDFLLLCTDGLSDKVRPEEMAERLATLGLREAVESLIALANERGGEDNITALAGKIEE